MKKILINPAQLYAVQVNRLGFKKRIFLEWGRGTGKSTILGWYLKECVRQMPRSTGIIVGETYQQILSRTLPSTKEGMEMFGLFEGVDYVVGRCGKDLGFDMPFQSPSNWRNVVHFSNGAIAILVSLDMENAGRGINAYWVIGDEAALLDYERLYNNVMTTNRATKEYFKKCSMLNASVFATSTPLTKRGKWFIEMEEKAKLKPEKYAFIKANAFVNKMNLSPEWFEDVKENAVSELHYNAEILNIRPPSIANSFYKDFSEDIHTYGNSFDFGYLNNIDVNEYVSKQHNNCLQDLDLIPNQQLEISIDPGKNINSMTVWQKDWDKNIERCLKEFFVKDPKDHEDLVKLFDEYYSAHRNRCNTVLLRHDASAFKTRDRNNIKISERIENLLRELGWRVINRTPYTNNPFHNAKYLVLNALLKRNYQSFPKILINRDNCPNLVISITNAETELKRDNDFGKDKSSERDLNLPQEHATHLSDTFDYHLYWKYEDLVTGDAQSSFFVPMN